MSLNSFNTPPARDGTMVISTIDTAALLTLCSDASGGTYFDSTSKFRRVDFSYYSPDTRQKKVLVHNPFMGRVAWTAGADDGTWALNAVRAVDTDGGELNIGRSVIGSSSDVVL